MLLDDHHGPNRGTAPAQTGGFRRPPGAPDITGAGAGVPVAGTIRREVARVLRRHGADLTGQAAGDCLLVASELATNALLHGGGIVSSAARVTAAGLEISLRDPSGELPRTVQRPRPPGGFGWRLTRRLATAIRIDLHLSADEHGPAGKTIAVTMPLEPATTTAPRSPREGDTL